MADNAAGCLLILIACIIKTPAMRAAEMYGYKVDTGTCT